MTDAFISKKFNGATRRYDAGGYQTNQGYYVASSLAKQSNLDLSNDEDKIPLFPLQTPFPRTRWVKDHSNNNQGRPSVNKDRYLPCPEENRIDYYSTQKQNVITHQYGYRSVEGNGTDSGPNVHGLQWYDVTPMKDPIKVENPDAKDINYEASRFQYGRAEVPSNLGYDLPGATASLQRDNHKFLTTGYYRPGGYHRGGYLGGRNGLSNKLGALPQNVNYSTKGLPA